MADINFLPQAAEADSAGESGIGEAEGLDFEIIEKLFFAYRDFVAEADQTLAAFGFGRAHHRVVYFVSRRPGLRVSDLLDILRITKQSLARVLKELVDGGYIEQRPGPVDRRERLLHATAKGRQLAIDLSFHQDARIVRALAGMPEGARTIVRDFLANMTDREPYRLTGDGRS